MGWCVTTPSADPRSDKACSGPRAAAEPIRPCDTFPSSILAAIGSATALPEQSGNAPKAAKSPQVRLLAQPSIRATSAGADGQVCKTWYPFPINIGDYP